MNLNFCKEIGLPPRQRHKVEFFVHFYFVILISSVLTIYYKAGHIYIHYNAEAGELIASLSLSVQSYVVLNLHEEVKLTNRNTNELQVNRFSS